MGRLNYKFTRHALDQLQERGITEREVRDTVEAGLLVEVSENRAIRRRIFTQGYSWVGRNYSHKEVTVVYALEEGFIIVITVIARYGRWEGA